jgi:hypothetical protein
MPSKVILHIGLPKTGTTSLQRAFFENRGQLAANGISYPLPTASKWNAQHDFVRAFRHGGANAVQPLFDECRLQIEGSDRLLMSSEEFFTWRTPAVRAWKSYLDQRFEAPSYRIHLCIRRWSDLVPSLWHQHVIYCGVSSFPEFALGQLLRILREQHFQFEAIADAWIEAFGRDAVRIEPIERITEAGGDLVVQTFHSLLGIEAANLAGTYKSNRSLSAEQLELIRAVSIYGQRRHGKATKEVSFALRRLLRRGDSHVAGITKIFTPLRAELVLDDQHPPFPEMERAAIAKFGNLLEGIDSERIFPARDPRRTTYIRDVYWLDRGFQEAIESAHAYAAQGKAARRSSRSFPRRAWHKVRGWLSPREPQSR